MKEQKGKCKTDKEMAIEEICWDKSVKEAVWKKGRIYPDYSPNVLRWDVHGRIMMWSKFGRTDSRFGWHIVQVDPSLEIDPLNIDNLQPVNMGFQEEEKDDS
jgi:hypothetical protein